ncbi:MAG: hypothetical protein HFJ25_04770 [Clostridia bacterium]|nr:hypothetical protein [Clostridia bacterium]
MESVLNDILRLIGDATNYLKMFVAGATGFFVLKDCVMYMVASEDHQKAASLRRIRTTLIAGVTVFFVVQLVNWVLAYFK